MGRFFLGFVVASALWGALAYFYVTGALDGWLGVASDAEATADVATPTVADELAEDARGKRRKVKRPRVQKRAAANKAAGSSTSGDDIDWDGPRTVDMAAGEGQLIGSQIDAGFDSVMGRIRRCLILVDTDGELTGKLLFGMKVGSDGRVKAVNLSGPSVVTGGDSGSCLRDAAQSIRFAAFNGPDALFKYPITLQ